MSSVAGGTGNLRVAVAGVGYWGSKHIRVLHGIKDVGEVVAIDPWEERVSALRQVFPRLTSHADLEDALDRIDALVIATPPRMHAGMAEMALAAGVAVLIEKPLATSTADAISLIRRARSAGVPLMVGHTFEYNAAVWKLRELIASGELGTIHYLDTARLNLGLYQWDVNVVWDLAPHDISICNHILGSSPATVQAWGSRHAHAQLEDVAYLRLDYPDLGVVATIHVSWLDPCKVRRVTVVGSAKMAVYNDLAADERIRVFDKGVVRPETARTASDIPMSYRYGDISSPYIAFEEPLSVQDRHFVDCVLNGREPATPGENGLDVVRVLEAADRSLREGRPVRLADPAAARRRAALVGVPS